MMTPTVKFGLGALALGSVGGLGYLGTTYFNNDESDKVVNQPKTSISELINKEYKFKLLNTTAGENADKEYWKTNWDNYKKENDAEGIVKDVLSLKGWVKSTEQDLTEELKKECKKLSQNDFIKESDSIYGNVTKYCTRGVTVKEDAQRKGKEILNTEEPSKDSEIWTKRNASKKDLMSDFGKLKITGVEDTINADTIKKGCASAITRNKKDDQNYEEVYLAYEKVCTKQKGDSK